MKEVPFAVVCSLLAAVACSSSRSPAPKTSGDAGSTTDGAGVQSVGGTGAVASGGAGGGHGGAIGGDSGSAAATKDAGTSTCLFYAFQGADYRLLITDTLVNLELTPAEFKSATEKAYPARGPWPKQVAKHFRDEFDFQLYVMNEPQTPETAPATGVNERIHQAATGTGLEFAGKAGYEAWPHLLSILYLGSNYDLSGGCILHELVHTWANSVVPNKDADGHWPYPCDINGQIGGVSPPGGIRHVEGRTYVAKNRLDFFNRAYADIELYLMGFIPANQVPPVHCLENATFMSTSADRLEDTYEADGMKTFTIDEIVAKHGPRVPDYRQAKHDFRALPVVVSGGPLTAVEWRYFQAQAAMFSTTGEPAVDWSQGTLFSPALAPLSLGVGDNFHKATRGLGTIKLDGLLEVLIDRDSATCIATPAATSSVCATLRKRAADCGIPEAPCDADVTIAPADGPCVTACATEANCDVLLQATHAENTHENDFIKCARGCQCRSGQGCI